MQERLSLGSRNPSDGIVPDAEGEGISDDLGANILVYFPQSNEISV